MSLLDAVAGGLIAGRTNRRIVERKTAAEPSILENIRQDMQTINSLRNGCAGQHGGRFKQPCLMLYGSYYVNDINVPSKSIAQFTERDLQYHIMHKEEELQIPNTYAGTLTVLWYLAGQHPRLQKMVRRMPHWKQMYTHRFWKEMVEGYEHLEGCKILINYVGEFKLRFFRCLLMGKAAWLVYYMRSCSQHSIPGLEREF